MQVSIDNLKIHFTLSFLKEIKIGSSSKRRLSQCSEEFKRNAVTLTKDRSVKAVAEDLGIEFSLLSRWRQQQYLDLI